MISGYNLYGLRLNSNIKLKGWKEKKPYIHPHSTLEFGKVFRPSDGLENTIYRPFSVYNKEIFFLEIPTIAKYIIYNSNKVVIELYHQNKKNAGLIFFWDSILPILLLKNNFYPVHASAILDKYGYVHLFAGARGDGKSKLATALCLKGNFLISDDLCVLKWDKKQKTFITKSYTKHVDLWNDCISMFDGYTKEIKALYLRKKILKYRFDLSAYAKPNYQKVKSIFFIKVFNEEMNVHTTPLKGIKKINTSKNIIHSKDIAHVIAKDQNIFKFSSLIAQHLDLYTLNRSRLTLINETSDYLINEIFTTTAER